MQPFRTKGEMRQSPASRAISESYFKRDVDKQKLREMQHATEIKRNDSPCPETPASALKPREIPEFLITPPDTPKSERNDDIETPVTPTKSGASKKNKKNKQSKTCDAICQTDLSMDEFDLDSWSVSSDSSIAEIPKICPKKKQPAQTEIAARKLDESFEKAPKAKPESSTKVKDLIQKFSMGI